MILANNGNGVAKEANIHHLKASEIISKATNRALSQWMSEGGDITGQVDRQRTLPLEKTVHVF